jgi:hypothetical protein
MASVVTRTVGYVRASTAGLKLTALASLIRLLKILSMIATALGIIPNPTHPLNIVSSITSAVNVVSVPDDEYSIISVISTPSTITSSITEA